MLPQCSEKVFMYRIAMHRFRMCHVFCLRAFTTTTCLSIYGECLGNAEIIWQALSDPAEGVLVLTDLIMSPVDSP